MKSKLIKTKVEETALEPSSLSVKKLSELTPDSRNANAGSERGNQMIQDSLRDYGAGRSILLDKHGRVIAGNKTRQNAMLVGMDDVIVVQTTGNQVVAVQRMDLDLEEDSKAKALAIADNRSSEVSLNWDIEVLKGLRAEGVPLEQFWEPSELVSFFAGKGELIGDEDEVPPVPDEPKTKLGDVYRLGVHRLMCGDSTNIDAVERLMDGQKADMVFTDPPYGVSIVSGGSDGADKPFGQVGNIHSGKGIAPGPALRRGTDGTVSRGMKAVPMIIKANTYAEIIGDDTTETAIKSYELCAALKIPVMIFWGGNYYANSLPPSSCWIVWDKENGESFFADAEIAWTNQKTAVRIFKHKWNGLIKASERGEKRVHPTQKPIALAEWCFEQYGDVDDIVLDLFGGSGSTLIACEKTNRRCFMMELSPAYCDVICLRYYNATGNIPMREDGEPWKSESELAGIGSRKPSGTARDVE
jgi:hypothetical protein